MGIFLIRKFADLGKFLKIINFQTKKILNFRKMDNPQPIRAQTWALLWRNSTYSRQDSGRLLDLSFNYQGFSPQKHEPGTEGPNQELPVL